ncbi:MAG: type III PLP-dependent enzyme [Alphaproteobacteria bacterium]|nr:type III PLP-dependent enzyme [Alphaproteobacteria bacterium]
MAAALQPDMPVFCLRPHVLEATAKAFCAAFPGDVLYAAKCNDDPAVLGVLAGTGLAGFDVASLAELRRVRAAAPRAACWFMHPVKRPAEIRAAIHDHGVRAFALDHEDELAKIVEAAGPTGPDLTLVVRLAVSGRHALLDFGTKFGAEPAEAAALLQAVAARGWQAGLTFHVGSQCPEPQAWRAAIGLAGRTARAAGVPLALLDVGGGFPVAYDGVAVPEPAVFGDAIRVAAGEAGLPEGCRLVAEPGRALVAGSCSLVVRVELRRGDALYLNDGVYGSLHDLKHHGVRPPMRLLRPGGSACESAPAPFRLYGPTCDGCDALPGLVWLPGDIGRGDWIEIGQMGAYARVLRTDFNGLAECGTVAVADAPPLPETMSDEPAAAAIAA